MPQCLFVAIEAPERNAEVAMRPSEGWLNEQGALVPRNSLPGSSQRAEWSAMYR